MKTGTFRYKNPIYSPAIDAIRDCQITEVDGMYYLTGTSPPFWGKDRGESPSPGVKLYSSPDLLNWKFETFLIERAKLDPGVWYYDRFWAPEIHRKDERFWLTFNCRNETAEILLPHSVGLAAADSITGPYEILTHDKPLIERTNDATLFTDDDGKTYIYTSGIMGWEIDLPACRLIDGPFICFAKAPGCWDSIGIEGPFVIKRDGVYYMFYSSWTRGYEVGYATATHPKGPWRKYEGNPIFGAQSEETCAKYGGKFTPNPQAAHTSQPGITQSSQARTGGTGSSVTIRKQTGRNHSVSTPFGLRMVSSRPTARPGPDRQSTFDLPARNAS